MQSNPFEALPDAGATRIRVVASMLGVCQATCYNWIKAGRLPRPLRLGPNTVAIPNKALKTFGAKLAKEAA